MLPAFIFNFPSLLAVCLSHDLSLTVLYAALDLNERCVHCLLILDLQLFYLYLNCVVGFLHELVAFEVKLL
jgi:hypothetical protein